LQTTHAEKEAVTIRAHHIMQDADNSLVLCSGLGMIERELDKGELKMLYRLA